MSKEEQKMFRKKTNERLEALEKDVLNLQSPFRS